MAHLEFQKRLEMKRISKRPHAWQFFVFVPFVFRKKQGQVRNDFLDCMIELRQGGQDEVQGDVQSAENENKVHSFSKLQQNVILWVTEY
jgi:hypothetical protein